MSLIDGETYFNNFGQTGYEEIRDWTPAYYRNILEADANMYFAGWLKDVMAESLEKWCRNQFAAGMDEYTLGRMERFFYMEENATLDIEERRRLLGIAMAGTGKISTEKIAAWVKTYTGADCTFEFLHRLFIHINLGENDRVGDVETLMDKLESKIPAHIKFITEFATDLVFDWRDLEKIRLKNLTIFRFRLPFFYTDQLDGSFLLDGTHDLSGGIRIGLGVCVGSKFGFKTEQGISIYPTVNIPVETDEGVSGELVFLLATPNGETGRIRNRIKLHTEEAEKIPLITMTKRGRGAWFLDGSVTLNGAKTLNSIYEKEVIE